MAEPPELSCAVQEGVAEIVKIDNSNFYLYGQVELRKREDDERGDQAWSVRHEKIVARGFGREPLKIVKSMAVGDKVYGTLFFRRKTLEWLVRDVRPALGALSPLRLQEALYFNQEETHLRLDAFDAKATFTRVPAKVILWPDFAVTLVACRAVVRLHSRVKYYHGAKEITFKIAKLHLKALSKDELIEVDAELLGSHWKILAVFFPAGPPDELFQKVGALPVLGPQVQAEYGSEPLARDDVRRKTAETPDPAEVVKEAGAFCNGSCSPSPSVEGCPEVTGDFDVTAAEEAKKPADSTGDELTQIIVCHPDGTLILGH